MSLLYHARRMILASSKRPKKLIDKVVRGRSPLNETMLVVSSRNRKLHHRYGPQCYNQMAYIYLAIPINFEFLPSLNLGLQSQLPCSCIVSWVSYKYRAAIVPKSIKETKTNDFCILTFEPIFAFLSLDNKEAITFNTQGSVFPHFSELKNHTLFTCRDELDDLGQYAFGWNKTFMFDIYQHRYLVGCKVLLFVVCFLCYQLQQYSRKSDSIWVETGSRRRPREKEFHPPSDNQYFLITSLFSNELQSSGFSGDRCSSDNLCSSWVFRGPLFSFSSPSSFKSFTSISTLHPWLLPSPVILFNVLSGDLNLYSLHKTQFCFSGQIDRNYQTERLEDARPQTMDKPTKRLEDARPQVQSFDHNEKFLLTPNVHRLVLKDALIGY
ncbi:hypothetical protein OSB04_015623 [Centaurea solstitialis]|uniref:Uncharacterized protein n=1 Tax=Centaurea solstitialis TaxID=347529 RepID=A0AA38SZJ8_9ASTR|nr:hypothetical protein OSB04_015623 [Centaurea solstitialis]